MVVCRRTSECSCIVCTGSATVGQTLEADVTLYYNPQSEMDAKVCTWVMQQWGCLALCSCTAVHLMVCGDALGLPSPCGVMSAP